MTNLYTGHEADINATESELLTVEQMVSIIKNSVKEIPSVGDKTIFGDSSTHESIALCIERIAKSMLNYATDIRSANEQTK